MSNNIKVSTSLYTLVGVMSVLIIVVGYIGISGISTTRKGLRTVYEDRVVPLKELKIIADMYAVNIVDVSHKTRNGNISWAEARRNVDEATKTIQTKMQSYLATYLVEEEKKLINELRPNLSKADRFVKRLRKTLTEEDARQLEKITINELYQIIDPVSSKFSELVEIQLTIAKREYDKSVKLFNRNLTLAIACVVIGVIVSLVMALFIIRRLIRQLGGEPAEIAIIANQVAEGQFSVKQEERKSVGVYADLRKMAQSLTRAISSIQNTMSDVSKGDLRNRVDGSEMKGELAIIKNSIDSSMEMLSDTISQVVSATDQVSSNVNQISNASQILANGASEQAASLEEISSTMAEVDGQAKTNNDNANQAAQLTEKAMKTVTMGNEQMSDMLASMDSINTSSADISKIIKVIDDIAFQTNLLALNAAVEAARAGKYGKGFAVVAEEVRSLAGRSAEAAKNTTELIENSIKEVHAGVKNADKTAEVLSEISEEITKVNNLICEIAISSREQSNSTNEINDSLTQVNSVVQQNSSVSEETSSAAQELRGQASRLQILMERFQLNQNVSVAVGGIIQPFDRVEKPIGYRKLIEPQENRLKN